MHSDQLAPRLRARFVGTLRAAVGLWLAIAAMDAAAQPRNNQPGQGNLQNVFLPGGNQQTGTPFGGPNANNTAGPGGGTNADFESLIDLIQSTIAIDSWADAGGPGDIREFASGGVLIDTAGTLRLKSRQTAPEAANELAAKRGAAPAATATLGDARRTSALRYVSLPRLEREIARRQAAREPLDVSMLTLAGLQRVKYVFVYPETGDVVLAGPAGDWRIDSDGRILSRDSDQPIVRLDDLIVLLRRGAAGGESFFGCSINPRQESLAKTQAYLDATSKQPLQTGQRRQWLTKLRDSVGTQDIEVFGVDPSSRVALVLVEADYHMKLIGMGLADGVEGVQSYLASIEVKNGEAPPALSVLRWWFALNYEGVRSTAAGDAYELVGTGVRVLSENEMLAQQGQRVHTGQSDPLNRKFAENFTTHFAALADKYPIYADLRNIFDLAMAVALIQADKLPAKAGWMPGIMLDAERLRLPARAVPRQVETVINHRVINQRHVVAGVSGGVMIAAKEVLQNSRKSDDQGRLASNRSTARSENLANGVWWWDSAE
jgi:hypothetical protein